MPPSEASRKLQLALSKTDRVLVRLSALLSTPGGIDSTLCTVAYTLTFVHARLSSVLNSQLERLAIAVAKNASDALLPGETLIASIPAPAYTARLARFLDGSKKLTGVISDFRIFVRMWGLLDIYTWGRSTYLSGPKDPVIKSLVWAQIAVNFLFQYLENGAYLASKGVFQWDKAKETKWWLWSSRFWAAHVVLDFGRLARVWYTTSQEKKISEEGEKEAKIARKAEAERWWREVIVNAAYAPLTLHWSLEQGAVSESWVGFLGTVAGVVGVRQKWKAT